MTKNIDIINAVLALVIKAAILAARFFGRIRKQSLKRLAAMDVNNKDKEIIFLRDTIDQRGSARIFSLFFKSLHKGFFFHLS